MAVRDRPGVRPHMGDELREALRRKVLAHDEIARRSGDEADRLELARIVLDVLVERRRGAVAAEAADRERVAVGRRFRAARAAGRAAGAGEVLDHEALAER